MPIWISAESSRSKAAEVFLAFFFSQTEALPAWSVSA
jgi:hypothetical protein